MSIKMQGMWLVSVKSKSAVLPQQFKIEGATTGNGVYAGTVGSPEVFVNGDNWAITIQSNPGSGFQPSVMQITFPVSAAGFYRFDIQSNDNNVDEDFNDLILTCRTPIDSNDYIIYGNVSYYEGFCLFNPCNRRFVVIDTFESLRQAAINPSLRELVKAYYPSRFKTFERVALNPQPLPPHPEERFTPMVIPIIGNEAIPSKEKFVVRSKADAIDVNAEQRTKAEAQTFAFNRLLSKTATASAVTDISSVIQKDSIKIIDKYRLYCESGPLPDAILNFQEYDRSTGELAGEAYSGNGERAELGGSFADRNGNYIFRFRTNTSDVIDETQTDTATGESATTQAAPDVIVQLLCPGSTLPVFESAPYWNIGNLRRVNICVPKSKSCLIPLACNGQHILQGVGNIVLGAPSAAGTRIGSNNYLNTQGIITTYGDGAPALRCAAWNGILQLRGCLSNSQVKYYRLWSKRNTIFSFFTPYTRPFALPRFSGPNIIDSPVFDIANDAYINVETDTTYNWVTSYKNIKARINTNEFSGGSYVFKIQGFDAAMNPVAGTDETVTLYFEDQEISAAIDPDITMEGVGILGECALFTLPVVNDVMVEGAGLTLKFKAIHKPGGSTGFMNNYGLSMGKGAGGFAFTPAAAPANFMSPGVLDSVVNSGRCYVHGSDLVCITNFRGTVNEAVADGDGNYTVTIHPASGHWLEPGQPFCAFSIALSGTLRLTNGEGGYPYFYGGQVLIGIQRP